MTAGNAVPSARRGVPYRTLERAEGEATMSEWINNRKELTDEERREGLKSLIRELHAGRSAESVKEEFARVTEGISGDEIARLETELVREGMAPEEIQSMCDVHAAVFAERLEDEPSDPEETPGHPAQHMKAENRAIEELISRDVNPAIERYKADPKAEGMNLSAALSLLLDIDKHYARKEQLIFPYLEKYNRPAPAKVMWGVDDEIRGQLKYARDRARIADPDAAKYAAEAVRKIHEMIFKEERILIPMLVELLTEDEWFMIAQESDEVGYCLVEPETRWKPARADVGQSAAVEALQNAGLIRFPTGVLSNEQLMALMDALPVDITFVDDKDLVRYFNRADDRIFPRPKTVIGRHVSNCHPPASVHVVEKLVADFRSGARDQEDFWIRMGDKYVLIRYYAVRNEKREYLGTMEITFDIAPIQAITGQKRIISPSGADAG